MMRTWDTVAFILFLIAAVAAWFGHKVALVLVAAGLACTLVPVVFQLT
jgi:hypothetical protein